MKKIYLLVIAVTLLNTTHAQQVITFNEFTIPDDSFDNGKSQALNPSWKGFKHNYILFNNNYDTAWGGFWSKGFAISSKRDTSTAGFSNLYSCIADSGTAGQRYAIGQNKSSISWKDIGGNIYVKPKSIMVNNSTYAALSMRNGDQFAKKFGGASGNDSDWFMITFTGYYRGVKTINNPVTFMLADYRFADSTQDYIVNNWSTVDLTPLVGLKPPIDSIAISLSSSDTGAFGMNTPAFFCIDNFMYEVIYGGLDGAVKPLSIQTFPNPAGDLIHFSKNVENFEYSIMDVNGKLMNEGKVKNNSIQLNELKRGMYIIQLSHENERYSTRFIRE